MKQKGINIFCAVMLFSCSTDHHKPTITVIEGTAMTVPYKITVGKKTDPYQVQAIAAQVFSHIDNIYNNWNPFSEISKLNTLKKGEVAVLSEELARFLLFVDTMVQRTDGKFDPTIEPIRKLWKSYLEQGKKPPLELIERLKPAIGWHNISINEGIFSKADERTQIDLGGIAKGYCIDLLAEALNKKGYLDLLIDWGGELKATGLHPEKRAWKIFIRNLGDTDPQKAIDYVDITNQAMATSGDYLQNWNIITEKGQEKVSHLIDPKSCHPITIDNESIATVSILADSCAEADGLATAAMLFPSAPEAIAWLQTIPNITFWVTTNNPK